VPLSYWKSTLIGIALLLSCYSEAEAVTPQIKATQHRPQNGITINYKSQKQLAEKHKREVYNKYKNMSIQELIEYVKDPKQVQGYFYYYLRPDYDKEVYAIKIGEFIYKPENFVAPFKLVHEKGRDDCDGYAVAAAALLSDNGYGQDLLYLYSTNTKVEKAHIVYLYKQGEYYRVNSQSNEERSIKSKTLDELTSMLFKFHYKHKFDSFVVVSLPDRKQIDWINGGYYVGLKLTRYLDEEIGKAEKLKSIKKDG